MTRSFLKFTPKSDHLLTEIDYEVIIESVRIMLTPIHLVKINKL